jgi:hypothetical protein
MRIELQKQLKDKYPLLYKNLMNPEATPRTTCLFFGLECGEGWFGIIDRLSAKLEPLIAQAIKDNQDNPELDGYHPCAEQIKEKFGGLRFYMNWGTQEMYDLISATEDESYHTCEVCGKAEINASSSGGWVSTVCEECRDKYRNN